MSQPIISALQVRGGYLKLSWQTELADKLLVTKGSIIKMKKINPQRRHAESQLVCHGMFPKRNRESFLT